MVMALGEPMEVLTETKSMHLFKNLFCKVFLVHIFVLSVTLSGAVQTVAVSSCQIKISTERINKYKDEYLEEIKTIFSRRKKLFVALSICVSGAAIWLFGHGNLWCKNDDKNKEEANASEEKMKQVEHQVNLKRLAHSNAKGTAHQQK